MNLSSSFIRLILLSISCAVLAACAQKDLSDLEAHVEKIKKEEPMPLTPLPPFPPEPVVLFQCEKDNPFENFNKTSAEDFNKKLAEHRDDKRRDDCGQPDIYRNKQALEKFPLDSLLIVGTITINGEIFGLVQEPKEKHMIHKIRVNDWLGENYGKIVAITERQIDVIEMVPVEDEMGICYQQQMRKLFIDDGNKNQS